MSAGTAARGGRIVAFAGLAALAAGFWGALIADASTPRLAAVVAIALAGALALVRLDRSRVAESRANPLAALTVIASILAGLVALGLPVGHLLPGGWDELGAGVGTGLDGLAGRLDYPLSDTGPWTRLLVLSGLPVMLGLAIAHSFWPGRGDGPRLGGLAVLVAAYAIPSTVRASPGWIAGGLVLLGLIALWLWAPRLSTLAPALGLVLLGVVSIPLAVRLESNPPVLDYRTVALDAGAGPATYEWDHSYGPIDWQRSGETLFTVQSDRPGYWRAQTLDEFNGEVWERSSIGGGAGPEALPPPTSSPDYRREWIQRSSFAIDALVTPLAPAPGTSLTTAGLDPAATSRQPDGTLVLKSEPLAEGSAYSVVSYVPDPTPKEMRAAEPYAVGSFEYISIDVRRRTPGSEGFTEITPRSFALFSPGRPEIAASLADSDLAPVARLTDRLVADAPTAYDAAVAIQDHLLENYSYDEDPPRRPSPLPSFLFEDRVGYCQQFSGAMALMLRMAGIPARVAVGFTSGSRVEDAEDTFEVTDLNAHSWVEVYFTGIGWVRFDPTPPDTPARSSETSVDLNLPGSPAADSTGPLDLEQGGATAADRKPRGGAGDGGGSRLALFLVGLLGAGAALGGGAIVARSKRHRALAPGAAADLETAEMDRALAAAGYDGPTSRTLSAIEYQLTINRLPLAAGYAARLRSLRYERAADRVPPSLGERRAVRRELAKRRSLGSRIRLWAAMPPGGPRQQL